MLVGSWSGKFREHLENRLIQLQVVFDYNCLHMQAFSKSLQAETSFTCDITKKARLISEGCMQNELINSRLEHSVGIPLDTCEI